MKIKIKRTISNERAVIEYNKAMRALAQEAKNVGLGRKHIDELIENHNALVDEKNRLLEEKEIITKKIGKIEEEIKKASQVLAQVEKGSADYELIDDSIKAAKEEIVEKMKRVAEIDNFVKSLNASIAIASQSKKNADAMHKESSKRLFVSFNRFSERIQNVEKISEKNLYFEFVKQTLISQVLNKGESEFNTRDLLIEIEDENAAQSGEEE